MGFGAGGAPPPAAEPLPRRTPTPPLPSKIMETQHAAAWPLDGDGLLPHLYASLLGFTFKQARGRGEGERGGFGGEREGGRKAVPPHRPS